MIRSITSLAPVLAASSALATVAIPTVPIGNLGNAPDPLTGNLYGSVAYAYNIAATEVTNGQYAAFLNAVAATDTNNLYETGMAGAFGGITRSGSPGSYTYATVSGRETNPVNFVSFWDACRFANWLHNCQATGPQDASTTEDGAYTLTPAGISANTITRNPGWRWAVTSENEWYKAAYHQPAGQGGDSDNYWLYPTSSNSITTAQANYNNVIGNTRPAGSYAANFYGVFDMGGNVWEWNEAIIAANRGIRGGSFDNAVTDLRADDRDSGVFQGNSGGFRIVQAPPPLECPGDANADNLINSADLSVLLSQFGQSVIPGDGADFNNDCVVNSADLSVLLGTFGTSC